MLVGKGFGASLKSVSLLSLTDLFLLELVLYLSAWFCNSNLCCCSMSILCCSSFCLIWRSFSSSVRNFLIILIRFFLKPSAFTLLPRTVNISPSFLKLKNWFDEIERSMNRSTNIWNWVWFFWLKLGECLLFSINDNKS